MCGLLYYWLVSESILIWERWWTHFANGSFYFANELKFASSALGKMIGWFCFHWGGKLDENKIKVTLRTLHRELLLPNLENNFFVKVSVWVVSHWVATADVMRESPEYLATFAGASRFPGLSSPRLTFSQGHLQPISSAQELHWNLCNDFPLTGNMSRTWKHVDDG